MTPHFVLAAVLVAAPAAPVPKAPDRDALAKEAATQFMKALKAHDRDAVLKVADLPFCFDCKEVVKDAERLGKLFDGVFKEKDLTDLKFEVKEHFAAGKLPELVSKRDREAAKEFVKDFDFVVVMRLEHDGVAVLVRVRDGKAKVCGFCD